MPTAQTIARIEHRLAVYVRESRLSRWLYRRSEETYDHDPDLSREYYRHAVAADKAAAAAVDIHTQLPIPPRLETLAP